MRVLTSLLCILLLCCAFAQEKPMSLVWNGDFERTGAWTRQPGINLVDGRTGKCMEASTQGQASLDIPVTPGVQSYSVTVEIRTEDVIPVGSSNGPFGAPSSTNGFAFAAVYQLDAKNRIVEFNDFTCLTGTNDWQRYEYTFTTNPQAEIVSLRLGLHNAVGKAWYDNYIMVAGETPRGFGEVQMPASGKAPANSIAIFCQDAFPVIGQASDPKRLGKLLGDAGFEVKYLDAVALTDAVQFNSALFNILVLPYGQGFPSNARTNVTQFLHFGGSFISTGGYAFNQLLRLENDKWLTEKEITDIRIKEALKTPILPDGGFENTTVTPASSEENDGIWRPTSKYAEVTSEEAFEGKQCAVVQLKNGDPLQTIWACDITPKPGTVYRVSGMLKTDNVQPVGVGFAYIAVYQFDAEGKILTFRDFAQATGTKDWTQYQHDFPISTGAKRLNIQCGLYNATGKAFIDDIKLIDIADLRFTAMNTASGDPGDGLTLSPTQIGVFDADYRLQRVASIKGGQEQFLFDTSSSLDAPLIGWAASGVQSYDNARWVELLDARDRFGRKRGAAGALMMNYNGYYSNSIWAYFGVENQDLFDGSCSWIDEGIVNTARFITNGLFLHSFKTDRAGYRDGETVGAEVTIQNTSAVDRSVQIRIEALNTSGEAVALIANRFFTVETSNNVLIRDIWHTATFPAEVNRLKATLIVDNNPVDVMTTGFIALRPEVVATGAKLRFNENYLELNGRPTFLFGSDTYANVYSSSTENPYTWRLDHIAARDYGFNLYENLNWSKAPDYTFTDAEWNGFETMAQSTQAENIVFMPGYIIGGNVAIGQETVDKQAALCKEWARRLGNTPGLMHYLNGDYSFDPKDTATLTVMWNKWLADKYKTIDVLTTAWSENEVYGEWGSLAYPPPLSGRWDSVREGDRVRFDNSLTLKWNNTLVAGVRAEDRDHPITSEYYQFPFNGIDLPLTIGNQDISNIGFFDVPGDDIDKLPLRLRFNDLRMRGKSLSLGEYGVKTHPAWHQPGVWGYHIGRTEEEQKQLFMAVAHMGLGMGASKVQNWCLRDASEGVFPWGVFYPNGRLPKDVAYWHRNMSLVWRYFSPRYVAPQSAVLVPDNMRLGTSGARGYEIAYNSFRAMLANRTEFNVANEQNVEALTADTKFLVWPSPFCPDDGTVGKVKRWVSAGGTLLLTGDISRNSDRKLTRKDRLRELCGVEYVNEITAPTVREPLGTQDFTLNGLTVQLKACVEVRPAGATVILTDAAGRPLITRFKLGSGVVYYCTDPLELGLPQDVVTSLRALYELARQGLLGEKTNTTLVLPDDDVYVMKQPLHNNGIFTTAFNFSYDQPKTVILPAGDADLAVSVNPRYPAFSATKNANTLISVGTSGEAVLDGQPLITGTTQIMALSLDQKALPVSSAVLLCPFSTGRSTFQTKRDFKDQVVVTGQIEDGAWKTFDILAGAPKFDFDDDLMTCLFIVCERDEVDRWTASVEQAMRHPENLPR